MAEGERKWSVGLCFLWGVSGVCGLMLAALGVIYVLDRCYANHLSLQAIELLSIIRRFFALWWVILRKMVGDLTKIGG